ncbi:probable F-box protein At4g22060 [Triticum urartu]|uniref:probable F-box protein At4g22060 n=1 Tax=Triticum urartu TaxID=4572 RepID=UPI0020438292|nr:probable F-box protein At4g22060 [Triticum urartu]
MGKKQRRRAAWADLPEDLIGDVLRWLPSFADRARFRAVCRAWRAAWRSQPHPPAPWLAIPGNCVSLPDGAIHRVWSLPEDARATRCCGSLGDWVALVPADRPCRPFLLNLFSKARIPLPTWAE